MLELLLPSLIAMMAALLCILPFKSAIPDFWRRLLRIGIYHLFYSTFLLLPIAFSFQIPGTSFNWIGKVLAICFSIGFYIFWKQDIRESDFMTTRLAKGSLKKVGLFHI